MSDPTPPPPNPNHPPTYSDGHPLDKIHYREYKILLKPERLHCPERFEEYWDVVRHIGKKLGVGVATNENAFHRQVRQVLFYDTADFDLYNNRFILRKRTFYVDGWPKTDHELAIKYRHPDFQVAADINVHPNLVGESRIKFKEELLPLRDAIGGMRSLYSHNCVLTTPNILLDQGLADIQTVFPSLDQIGIPPDKRIDLVNNLAVVEIQTDPGFLDFGHGYRAKATIAIWRDRATETSLVGEFAFQAKFHRLEAVHEKAKRLSDEFYCAVQSHAPDWVQLGTTKTAMIYGIGSKKTANDE